MRASVAADFNKVKMTIDYRDMAIDIHHQADRLDTGASVWAHRPGHSRRSHPA
jgi:hypothetical protein